jgi:hypothetical protein
VKKGKAAGGADPVDPERLRREFPALDDGDLAAYLEVSRRILAERDPAARARLTRETLARARAARDGSGPADALAARYLAAIEKMQRK